jgi:hypothetical protein
MGRLRKQRRIEAQGPLREGEGMKIPEEIRIVGHTIQISLPHVFTERDDCLGLASIDGDKILLSDQNNGSPLVEEKIAENFLHEIGHHVCHIVTGKLCLGGDEIKHSLICRILFQVIRDNNLDFREGNDD